MKQVKNTLFYTVWTIISFLLSIGLKYIELSSKIISNTKLSFLMDWVHELIFVIGSILGIICAIVFFIVNHYWIKHKVTQKKFLVSIQFLSLLIITLLIAKIHYILEFDLDYI